MKCFKFVVSVARYAEKTSPQLLHVIICLKFFTHMDFHDHLVAVS